MHLIKCFGVLLITSALVQAMSPCRPDTYFSNPKRAPSAWRADATWVAVGVVVDRKERKVPYPNCGLEDPSKCNQHDESVLTVKVERYEKGKGPLKLSLQAAWCGPDPPGQAGGRYRFYGQDESSFIMYEKLGAGPDFAATTMDRLPQASRGSKPGHSGC